ncbi:MAG: cadherin-like beta sandwich domain-containing protein [Herbinix sp.]|nr:cadherin-like beta sandwich domain-containing protein [Herbinix sp.]
MKRRSYKLLIFCLFFILGGFLNINYVSAASANIEITTDNSQVAVGDTVLVYINISSDSMFGDIEANLIYDEDTLEYKSSVSFITGSSGFLKIADINISEGADNRKYALEFQALKVGKTNIEFSGPVMIYDYESELPMSVFFDSIELEVKAAHTASDNAFLSSLKTSPTSISPDFDKNLFEYSTNVDYDVNRLVVEAIPEDDKATIRVEGNDFLEEGENKVIVSVIAEAGNIIEYTIDVMKEIAPEEGAYTSPITPDKKHGSFEVVRVEGELFAIYGGKYKVMELPADVKIPTGYIKTKIIISGVSIPVLASEQLDNEFLLIYAENELGEAGLYSFDKEEKTMQRYRTILDPITEQIDEIDEELMNSKQYRSKLNIAAIIIALLSALCAVFVILSIRLFMKLKGYGED